MNNESEPKKNFLRHAFTLVELLIVIAIISILGTISIISYTNFIRVANESNDLTLLNELNNELKAIENKNNGIKPITYSRMQQSLLDEGSSKVSDLEPSSNKDYKYAYNFKTNTLVLLNYKENKTIGFNNKITSFLKQEESDYFLPVGSIKEIEEINNSNNANKHHYSFYLKDNFINDDSSYLFNSGLDVGSNNDLEAIEYLLDEEMNQEDILVNTNNSLKTLVLRDYLASRSSISLYGNPTIVESNLTSSSLSIYGSVNYLELTKGNVNVLGEVNLAYTESSSSSACLKGNVKHAHASSKAIAFDQNDNPTSVTWDYPEDDSEIALQNHANNWSLEKEVASLKGESLDETFSKVKNEDGTQKYTCRNGNKPYEQIEEAINSASINETITLLTNHYLLNPLTITDGKSVTIDLNGYDLVGNDSFYIDNYGELIIKDSKTNANTSKVGFIDNNETNDKLTIYNGLYEGIANYNNVVSEVTIINGYFKDDSVNTIISNAFITVDNLDSLYKDSYPYKVEPISLTNCVAIVNDQIPFKTIDLALNSLKNKDDVNSIKINRDLTSYTSIDYSLKGVINIKDNENIIFDLNHHNLIIKNNSNLDNLAIISVQTNSSLTIIGQGTIQTLNKKMKLFSVYGTLRVNDSCLVNFYSGSSIQDNAQISSLNGDTVLSGGYYNFQVSSNYLEDTYVCEFDTKTSLYQIHLQ